MNVLVVMELVLSLAQAGSKLFAQLEEATALVRKLQAENRDATQAEWDQLNAAADEAKDQLTQAIADARDRAKQPPAV